VRDSLIFVSLLDERYDLTGEMTRHFPRQAWLLIVLLHLLPLNKVLQTTVRAMIHNLHDRKLIAVHLPIRIVRVGLIIDKDTVDVDDVWEVLEAGKNELLLQDGFVIVRRTHHLTHHTPLHEASAVVPARLLAHYNIHVREGAFVTLLGGQIDVVIRVFGAVRLNSLVCFIVEYVVVEEEHTLLRLVLLRHVEHI
jgi:hypothetical protein